MKNNFSIIVATALLTACGSDSSSSNNKKPALTDGYDTQISSITLDADERLWLSIANADSPAIVIYDTDSNTRNGDFIALTMPTKDIEFLDNGQYVAQLISADYTSSQIATGSQSGSRAATEGILTKTQSDYIIESYRNNVYHIGRYLIDSITKYDADINLVDAVWEYSANGDANTDVLSANPFDLIHESDNKAYLLRQDSPFVWQINPQAAEEEDFVVDKIDLSAYSIEGQKAPHTAAAAIKNGRLYIAMQRRDSNFEPQTGYISVIDTSNNEEIDTDPTKDGLKGIAINTTNAFAVDIQDDYLYVQGRGAFRATSHGGIDRINLNSYAVESITNDSTFDFMNANLNDEDSSNDVGFHVTGMAVLSNTEMYITITQEQGYTTLNTRVAQFNPETGKLVELIEVPRK